MLKDINTIEDLNFLLENKVSEDIDLDYKSKLPNLSKDESRVEFLRDICSFANAQGGQIIYGIEELRGKAIPGKISGVDLSDPDSAIRMLQGIIRSGIEEPISGITLREIRLEENKFCLVLKIAKFLILLIVLKLTLTKIIGFMEELLKKNMNFLFMR